MIMTALFWQVCNIWLWQHYSGRCVPYDYDSTTLAGV